MAYLPDDNCYWIATGEVLCQKQKKRVSFEQFANIAKLGEACDDATCEKGSTCFTKEGETKEFCQKVLWEKGTGCASQANNVCMQGLNCSNDVCVKKGTQNTTEPTETAPTTESTDTAPTVTAPTTPVATETAVTSPPTETIQITPVATDNIYKVILFIVVGILVILSIVAIIYMLTRTTSSSYNSSTYRSTF